MVSYLLILRISADALLYLIRSADAVNKSLSIMFLTDAPYYETPANKTAGLFV